MKKISLLLILSTLFSCSRFHTEGVKSNSSKLRVLWGKNFDGNYDTGNMPIALNSPLIHEGIVYIGTEKGWIHAYQAVDGREIFSFKENGGYHAAPIIHKDVLIFGTNQGRIVARHALSGKVIYKVDLDASVESQGVVYKGRIFFHTRNHKIFCLDVITGKILWSYKRSVPFLTTLQRVSRPLVHKGKVYVGFADGNMVSFGLEEGVVLWEQKISEGNKFIDVDLSPTVFKNKLLVSSMDGGLVLLSPETGAILRKLNYNITRKPLIYHDEIIFGTSSGELIKLDKFFSEVLSTKISKKGISSLALWKEDLVVGTLGDKVYLVGPKDFKEREIFSLGSHYSAIFGKIQSQDDYLALLSSRNRLYVFR